MSDHTPKIIKMAIRAFVMAIAWGLYTLKQDAKN